MQSEHKYESWCREEEGQHFSLQELPQQRWTASSGIQGNPTGDAENPPFSWPPSCLVLHHWLCVSCVPLFQGAENCLEGCVFVVTGVLECMERDDAKSLIERYGGKVTSSISKKTTYLVQGRDSGASKLEKVTNKFRPREAFPEKYACDCWEHQSWLLDDFIMIWLCKYIYWYIWTHLQWCS